MAQSNALVGSAQPTKKRKEPPVTSQAGGKTHQQPSQKRPRTDYRGRQQDARVLATQTGNKAFVNGALDVDSFVKAREFEIRALEEGMQRSRKALNRRAFQQVPKELRRRTASHNVKRVPQRLRQKSAKEMKEDNTPTVTARRRKPDRKMRLRLETVKKLKVLSASSRRTRHAVQAFDGRSDGQPVVNRHDAVDTDTSTVRARAPKVKKATLAQPPVPKAKFRKRQLHKSWLPTHLFHAKRANMTAPSAPLWRFALPLSPTQKSYRPIHHASGARGAVAWDTSYLSTIRLEGEQRSIDGTLKALGSLDCERLSAAFVKKWRAGLRVLETFVLEREAPHLIIAPVTLIWCVESISIRTNNLLQEGKQKRRLFLRVHPSAFLQVWEEVNRLARIAKPSLGVEDVRFEIGSIQADGPGSTESLLATLWPSPSIDNHSDQEGDRVGIIWRKLSGLTNTAMLPKGALLAFDVQDPRLHHPPRTVRLPKTQEEHESLTQVAATWPVDSEQNTAGLFDRKSRLLGSKLPSQKAVNRRRTLSDPGTYPEIISSDPRIPVILYTSPNNRWTLLAPWKTIQPIWYSLVYYPLSTGQQPRFGGLNEQRQLAFEAGQPWFPGDFPGTHAGWEWELTERRRRWDDWNRRPKGKRLAWEKVRLGDGKRGEIGQGWACDWDFLLHGDRTRTMRKNTSDTALNGDQHSDAVVNTEIGEVAPAQTQSKPPELSHLTSIGARALLNASRDAMADHEGKLITIRLSLVTRGVPQTCARIYRLPAADTNATLRRAWLALLHCPLKAHGESTGLPHACFAKDAPPHLVHQRLARSLLAPPRIGSDDYPACPPASDLIGFVTSGNFNLAEGHGTGIGCILLERVLGDGSAAENERNICIVRNAGADIGRLARWAVA